jgi:5-formyltetrahydrofolate cyclo-ligase
MTKQELRKTYFQKRLALSADEYRKLSELLCTVLVENVSLSAVKVLHTFIPIEKNKEPDTWLIIDKVKKEFPHISISIPKINDQMGVLDNFFYEGPDQLEKNTWGILEPKQGKPTPLEKIDIVLVPLLAADEQGHRVGYGRGFYDKFLNQSPASLKKIGLSFFPPVKSITDVNTNDHELTHLVTPEKFYTFS